MKANVFIDDKHVGTTPVLIKDQVTGEHSIRFELVGYYSSSIQVNVQSSITNLNTILTPQTFSLYLPGQQAIVINQQEYKNEEIKNLPEGYYHFKPGQDAVTMQRLNPNAQFIYISLGATIIGLAAGILGSLNANDSYNKFNQATTLDVAVNYMNAATFWDNCSIFGWTLTGLGAGASVYFLIDDANFAKENQAIKVASQSIQEEDVTYYEKGMDLISQGDTPNAVKNFQKIIDSFPNSRFIPSSLFRLAQVAFQNKEYNKAAEFLERIKREYPIYEIYELAVKQLADCYIALQSYDKAIENYKEVNQLNTIYSKESIEYAVIDTMYLLYKKNKDPKVKEQLKKLVSEYTGNPSYSQDNKNSVLNIKID
jgi:TolA-binding protein